MKPSQHSRALVAALGLVLFVAACRSSQNQPPNAKSQLSAAPVASIAPPNGPPPGPWAPAKGGEIWRSESTGKVYRVKIAGNKLYAEWVNLSPIAARYHSYIRTECLRNGSKWVGTSDIFLPCTNGEGAEEHIANTCHLKMQIEIDLVSKKLIKGRGQGLSKFDCGSCQAVTGWGNFEWVPAQQKTAEPPAATGKH